MKRIKILLFILLFIPFFVRAETCNTDSLTIKSITLDNDKTIGVEEKTIASINDNNILLDLSISSLGDKAEYLIIIRNDSNEDYELNDQINNDSDYIEYSIETPDNSNIVNANSEKEVLLKVEYKNEVPDSSFIDGNYSDNKTIAFNLINDTNQGIMIADLYPDIAPITVKNFKKLVSEKFYDNLVLCHINNNCNFNNRYNCICNII